VFLMPTSIGLSAGTTVEIISAYTATNQQLPAVPAEPGWYVVGTFYLPISARARLEIIGSVSDAGLTLRGRIFDMTDGAEISGSHAETSSVLDDRETSGFVDLTGGRVYQIQAEVIGPSGFGCVKSATLF
jgi:hypothetical protein